MEMIIRKETRIDILFHLVKGKSTSVILFGVIIANISNMKKIDQGSILSNAFKK